MVDFVHLRVHSEYSVVDSLVRIRPMLARTTALGMPAVALTDRDNLFALIKYYRSCEEAGLKPLPGADLAVVAADGTEFRILLLIQNELGYRNLTRLVTNAYVDKEGIWGRVRREDVLALNGGLVALSDAREGEIAQILLGSRPETAGDCLRDWRDAFGDRYYLEILRSGRPQDEEILTATVGLAVASDTPVVATNDVRFLDREDFEAHEARVCVYESRVLDDPRRPRRYSEEQYLKSPEEMATLFADLPSALANTVEIAQRCNLSLTLNQPSLPQYPVPADQSLDEFFRQEARHGLQQRLETLLGDRAADPEARRPYDERLDEELAIILQMGFSGYFLIVMEFVRWAKDNGVRVGPGRGSGVGSLVAWSLGITDLDPLAYDLLFERFLNPERVSMPDFDVDFCIEGRDRVIEHVAELYGHESVSQIITYGTMAAKAVVRDVARVQGKAYGLADRLSKMIPFEVGMTLHRAVEEQQELRALLDEDSDVAEIWEMALKLEGLVRNVGRHAGGVVIAPGKLTDFTPLYADAGTEALVSQFDKDDVEAAGLVKFDFLGLRTLTIIEWAMGEVNRSRQQAGLAPVDIDRVPLADPAVFRLLQSGETTAVFQLESRGMKDLFRRLQPDSFEEVIALVALFRPGPLQSGMVDDFIDRKHGRAAVVYPHPELEPVLRNTWGVILYQEQVMQIAQVLAGFSLGGADILRRAMGKKKPEEMKRQRDIFRAGATDRGVDDQLAMQIFDLMEKFAGYGLNKSHSAAYAMVSYQTAWLKTHYPAEFMAAVLSADMDNTDKLMALVDECRRMQLTLEPPDVNRGVLRFGVSDGAIVYGLGAVKGVGDGPVVALVAERCAHGPYADLVDFCRRVDSRQAGRRVVEALIRAGAMDQLRKGEMDAVRPALLAQLDDALQTAEQEARNVDLGMEDLFAADGGIELTTPKPAAEGLRWGVGERLAAERESLGLYLSGHPIEVYQAELAQFSSARIVDLRPSAPGQIVAGLVTSVRAIRSRRGDEMIFAMLDDGSGSVEISLFADVASSGREVLVGNHIAVVEGEVYSDDRSGEVRLRASALFDLAGARSRFGRQLVVCVDDCGAGNGRVADTLQRILAPYRRPGCRIALDYASSQARGRLVLGADWSVHPCDELLTDLRGAFGDEQVFMDYGRPLH